MCQLGEEEDNEKEASEAGQGNKEDDASMHAGADEYSTGTDKNSLI